MFIHDCICSMCVCVYLCERVHKRLWFSKIYSCFGIWMPDLIWIEKLNASIAAVVYFHYVARSTTRTRSLCLIYVITFILFFKTNSRKKRMFAEKRSSSADELRLLSRFYSMHLQFACQTNGSERDTFAIRREGRARDCVSHLPGNNVNLENRVEMSSLNCFTCATRKKEKNSLR